MNETFGTIAGATLLVVSVGLMATLIVAFRQLMTTIVADASGQDALDREVEQMFGPDGHGIYPSKGGDPSRPSD